MTRLMTNAVDIQESGRVVLEGRRFPDSQPVRVEVSDGLIRAVEPQTALGESPGTERWIAPGFFDLQVNGFGGLDLPDPNLGVEGVGRIARMILATGTTRFLPTIITGDLEAMCRQCSMIVDAMERDPLVGLMCPGIHVEGPFIHPEDGPRGAHPRQFVRDPNGADFERLNEACRGRLAILTLAPERPGAVEVIRAARQAGVLVALGHHRADPQSIENAIEAGARMTTHLGNGSDAVLPRHDNYVWRQLGEDRLWASFISDGQHLPAATLRSMLRAKTLERCVLITDAMAAAGMPPGRFRLGDSEVEKTPSGRVIVPGTPYLAGSAADMPLIVSRAVADGGISLIEAVRLVTSQPAALLPGPFDPWACEVDRPANLVAFDWIPAEARLSPRVAVIGRFWCGQEPVTGQAGSAV